MAYCLLLWLCVVWVGSEVKLTSMWRNNKDELSLCWMWYLLFAAESGLFCPKAQLVSKYEPVSMTLPANYNAIWSYHVIGCLNIWNTWALEVQSIAPPTETPGFDYYIWCEGNGLFNKTCIKTRFISTRSIECHVATLLSVTPDFLMTSPRGSHD